MRWRSRRVSPRWLAGTMFTGFAGAGLLGGALHIAADGAVLSEPIRFTGVPVAGAAPARKGDRPLVALAPAPPRERILRVPTMTRLGPSVVIRKKPFALASAPLGIAAPASYAAFDPLAVFSASQADAVNASTESLYGADVEAPVTTRRSPFPLGATFTDRAISTPAAALAVARARPALDRSAAHVAALPYLSPIAKGPVTAAVDPEAADDPFAMFDKGHGTGRGHGTGKGHGVGKAPAPPLTTALMLEAENVSRVERVGGGLDLGAPMAREEVLSISAADRLVPRLTAALRHYGADGDFATALGRAASDGLAGATEATLRIAYHADPSANGAGARSVRRISVYRGRDHVASLARTDGGAITAAPAPLPVRAAFEWDRDERVRLSASMPTVYDGLMRAALSQGLSEVQGHRLVRIMAFDLDFRAKVGPRDHLEVFYEVDERPDGAAEATDDATSRILYAAATVSGTTRRYYRLVSPDGAVAFFDEAGRSSRKFLLRKPVPNGRFTSPYGMRRHPKLRYRKMHTGVDWAARTGTPILASGHGTVVKAGWAGGYGRQVKIRHANGYVTSYSHLRRYAKGIRKGAKVRQGQIIGQVGSSGLSTGPHLHYEVIVNGRKVNPMRIRVPRDTTLTGPRLAAFERERKRIDDLVARARGDTDGGGGENGERTAAR